MVRHLLVLLILEILVESSLFARISTYDVKGFKVYTKYCKKCHGNAYKGASMKRQYEWKKLFEHNNKKFYSLHAKVLNLQDNISIHMSKKKMKHLQKFLIQSASDSGVVPGCDGNFCGS